MNAEMRNNVLTAMQRDWPAGRANLIRRSLLANKPVRAWIETQAQKPLLVMITQDNLRLERIL